MMNVLKCLPAIAIALTFGGRRVGVVRFGSVESKTFRFASVLCILSIQYCNSGVYDMLLKATIDLKFRPFQKERHNIENQDGRHTRTRLCIIAVGFRETTPYIHPW
jgi:hypothetical protein